MNFDFKDLEKFINQETGGRLPEGMEELQSLTNQFMNNRNNAGLAAFEGYSPIEMQQMINYPWEYSGPVTILQVDYSVLSKVPIYNMVTYLLDMIRRHGEIKLTQTGNLPTQTVRELYEQKFISDYWLDSRNLKIIKETDSESITLSRIIAEVSKLFKKRNNKISLTKTGQTLFDDPSGLFQTIIVSYMNRFNWAYLDGYGMEGEFRRGVMFSLLLMDKFGKQNRPVEFYADKYLKAFPHILNQVYPRYENQDVKRTAQRCYSLRTHERFMNYFGLIELEKGRGWKDVDQVKQSAIFKKIVRVSPPGLS